MLPFINLNITQQIAFARINQTAFAFGAITSPVRLASLYACQVPARQTSDNVTVYNIVTRLYCL